MKRLKKVLDLLELQDYDDSDCTKVLITVPNIVDKDVTLMFNGWKVKLHDDGKWSVKENR